MIALPNRLPLVKDENENLVACDSDLIGEKVQAAAQAARLPGFVSEGVADGIFLYLSNHRKGTVIDDRELDGRIHDLLDKIGMNPVAEDIDWTMSLTRINLAELAKNVGNGGETGFFSMLESKCLESLHSGVCNIIIHGLEECLDVLKKSCNSSFTQPGLREAIEMQLNDVRRIGEVSLPIFNVTVQ